MSTLAQSLIDSGAIPQDILSQAADIANDFKVTSNFKRIIEALNYISENHPPLNLITGIHGGGKTSSAKFYAAKYDNIRFWEAPPSYRDKDIASDLTNMLAISTGAGWRLRTSVLIDQLKIKKMVFVIDEAQRMDYRAFDYTKYLADNTGCSFVFLASSSLEKRIARWPDISSRVGMRLKITPMELAEFQELYGCQEPNPACFTPEALAEIHRLSKGVMRSIINIFAQLEEAKDIHRHTTGQEFDNRLISPHDVRGIAGKTIMYAQE